MRLIDADELIEGRVENDPVRIAAECAQTAFDKKKVIDDLENLKNNLIDCNDLCGECVEIECDQCTLEKAIKIVEKGGIE